jgi:hypothetical protein
MIKIEKSYIYFRERERERERAIIVSYKTISTIDEDNLYL